MRESLSERETFLMRRAKHREERATDRVRVALRVPERVERRAQAVVVVGEDLIHASGKVVERVAVRRQDPCHLPRPHRT